ncbi:MAG: dipeptidase PepE [Prevotellaceae bacterium]|jgi:dipeptidase E|nr:dipeptidase PepE [Prevotellaceae bacterium]
MKLLLLSNSTNAGEAYLDYPKYEIRKFLGQAPIEALFIPYAAVTFSYDDYERKVNERFAEIGHAVTGIHHFADPVDAVRNAKVIVVGGGNTWKLVRMLYLNKLILPVREKALSGAPYLGWSAGSNVACPTLRTTNDMPIVHPIGFETFNLVPFQINPHYTDSHQQNHAGETREQRIEEFLAENRKTYVVGLREGTMLKYEDNRLCMIGERKARIFRFGCAPKELSENDSFDFLYE